jgi:hypothetical protein
MGNLFCRSCGVRLDMNQVEEQFRKDHTGLGKENRKRIYKVARKIISLVVLLLVLAVLAGLFLSVPIRVEGDLSSEGLAAAKMKYHSLRTKTPKRPGAELSYTFSSQEISALASQMAGLDGGEAAAEEGGALALEPKALTLELLASGYVRAVLQSATIKNIKVYTTLIGRPEVSEGKLQMRIYSAKIGRVPMVGPLKKIAVSRFAVLFDDQAGLQELCQRVDEIEVFADKATLTINAP